MASDSEWELVDREEEDRPILGVFIPSVGFLPFGKQEDLPDWPAVVPTTPFTVVSSSAGLVLSRGPWSAYHVVDTLSGSHHHLPRPSLAHRSDVPSVVIRVGRPTPAAAAGLFAVVCAIGGADGAYAFDAFDSLSGRWSLSAPGERFAVGRIDPDSGVAAAGSAYWRTCSSPTPMVVGYDPSSGGRVRILTPPPGAWASEDRWQLGSSMRGGLCSVVLTDTDQAFGYELEASSDRWGLAGSVQLAGLASAEPVRFECSGPTTTAMEVVLLLEGKLMVVDLKGEKVLSIKEVPPPITPTMIAKKMVPCVGKKPKISVEEYVKVDDAA